MTGGAGLHPVGEQSARIAAIKAAVGDSMFLNARVDLFLHHDAAQHADHLAAAIERAAAYVSAGADGVFLPGLSDLTLIKQACDAIKAPVNVMSGPGAAPISALSEAGVARISHGPWPYRDMIAELTRAAVV